MGIHALIPIVLLCLMHTCKGQFGGPQLPICQHLGCNGPGILRPPICIRLCGPTIFKGLGKRKSPYRSSLPPFQLPICDQLGCNGPGIIRPQICIRLCGPPIFKSVGVTRPPIWEDDWWGEPPVWEDPWWKGRGGANKWLQMDQALRQGWGK